MAFVSLAIGGLVAVAIVLLAVNNISPTRWMSLRVFAGVTLAVGLLGLVAGVIGLIRGRWVTRLVAVAGILVDLGLTLFGLVGLWVAYVFPNGLTFLT